MSSTERRPSARRSPFASSTRSLPPFVARVAPFAAFIALLAASPLVEGHVDARWLVVARGLVAAALLALFWRAYVEWHDVPATPAGHWMAAVAAGFAVAVLWIALDADWAWMGERGGGFVPLRADGSFDPWLVGLRLFGLVLVVPLMEELFWRSFLMRRIDRQDFLGLDPRKCSFSAVALSSAVFALEHSAWFAGVVAGLAYGIVYRYTGNLRVATASHATSNATLGAWILATHEWSLW